MIREMEKNYPELKKILDDPYGSVYLHEGMYEETIRFLEDRMSQHGGEVDLIAMYDGNDMEGAYLKAALGRLMVTCDFKDIATYESSVRRMEASHGRVNPELNPLMLNQDLLELIKLDSKEANERIGKKGFFRWQEENKRLGSILEEGVNNFAYGLMMYHSAMVEMDALSRQQRDVKMPRKAEQQGEAKQQGIIKQQSEVTWKGVQESKVVEGGSGAGFRDMMSPEEALRYDEYWSQGAGSYRNVKLPDGTKMEVIFNGKNPSTRQRLQAPPGTKSITDVKYGKSGEMYYRETIFDEYGRRIGNNDYSDHGRPDIPSHTIPHHHPNSPSDPSHHGDGVPGLHPNTPN